MNSYCTDKAVADCVMARARQIISPGGNWEPIVIASYVKALDSLQKALDCPKQRYQPEVLCATEILSLYELLDPSGEAPWIRHTAGAAKLILVRGPKNYNTEFEQALFLAMVRRHFLLRIIASWVLFRHFLVVDNSGNLLLTSSYTCSGNTNSEIWTYRQYLS